MPEIVVGYQAAIPLKKPRTGPQQQGYMSEDWLSVALC